MNILIFWRKLFSVPAGITAPNISIAKFEKLHNQSSTYVKFFLHLYLGLPAVRPPVCKVSADVQLFVPHP